MGIIIKDIKIPDEDYIFVSNDGNTSNVLSGLSKINIFIGENNSGKSRLMRSILKKGNIEFVPNKNDINLINKFIINFKADLQEYYSKYNFNNVANLNELVNNLNELKFLESDIINLKQIKEINNYLNKILKQSTFSYETKTNELWSKESKDSVHEREDLTNVYNNNFNQYLKRIDKNHYKFKKIYIPILRGLLPVNYGEKIEGKPLKNFDNDVYRYRIEQDYPELKENCNIFTGLKTYEYYADYIGHEDDRKQDLINEYKDLLSKILNDNIEITALTNEIKNNHISRFKIRTGTERGRLIHELGDGIQSIIIMTFPLLIYEEKISEQYENLLIFIEEPEQLLHPSLQRKLINVFLDERFNKYQFFLTTHSNHFLDILLESDDVSIFSISKHLDEEYNSKFIIKNVLYGDNNLLELLGVRNSSVFLPNCNIWVEGITDVLYLRRYLEIYQEYKKNDNKIPKIFDEDRHYSFFVYNGSDISNLLNLNLDKSDKRLSSLFVLRDGDTEHEKDKKLQNISLNEKLDENFKLLNCWEIENLLSKKVILETLQNDKRYQNIQLNEEFEEEEYKDKDLSVFIKEKICDNQIDWNPIGKKKKFYYKAEKHIKNYEDLSQETLKICKNIYKFIESQNTI